MRCVLAKIRPYGILFILTLAALATTPLAFAEKRATLIILHTNDEHSAVVPHSPTIDGGADGTLGGTGGIARVATLVDRIREKNLPLGHPVLLLSAGDFTGGGIYSWLSLQGRSCLLEIMQQQLRYDAIAIGNHEFDYGPLVLAKNLIHAANLMPVPQTTMLATCLVVPPSHPLAGPGLLQKYRMIALPDGTKVGLFSLFGDHAREVTKRADDIGFADPLATASLAVRELKGQGADLIIALTHSGVIEDEALAKKVHGIDLIVGGHSHDALPEPLKVGDSWIVQAGDRTRFLGEVELSYDPQRRRTLSVSGRLIAVDSTILAKKELLPAIHECSAALDKLVATESHGVIRDAKMVIGTTEASLKHSGEALESPLGDFVTDAMRLMVQRKTGERVDLALMSNGLIRGSLIPSQAAPTRGQIGFMDMADLVSLGSGPDEGSPGYPLSSIYVTGKEVQRLWELVFIMVQGGGDLYFQQMSGARIAYAPNLVELFKIPFWNLRLPSGRASEKIEIFSGDGVQTPESGDYTPIEGQRLYRLVLPSYTLAFLPALSKNMPWLAVVPKNNLGLPLSDLADAVIRIDGHPYKVWQALFDYIQSGKKKSADSLPMIDARYYRPDQRITAVWRMPYWGWAVCLFSVVALIVLLKKLKIGFYFLGK